MPFRGRRRRFRGIARSHARRYGKKGRMTRLPRSEQFINMLGGWAQNRRNLEQVRTMDFTTPMITGTLNITEGSLYETRRLIWNLQQLTDIGVPQRLAWQFYRVSQMQLFVEIEPASPPRIAQVAIATEKYGSNLPTNLPISSDPTDAKNLPGCQTKILNWQSSTASTGSESIQPVLSTIVYAPKYFLETRQNDTAANFQPATRSSAFLDTAIDNTNWHGVLLTMQRTSTLSTAEAYFIRYFWKVKLQFKGQRYQLAAAEGPGAIKMKPSPYHGCEPKPIGFECNPLLLKMVRDIPSVYTHPDQSLHLRSDACCSTSAEVVMEGHDTPDL